MSVEVSYKKQFVLYLFLTLAILTIVEIGARVYEYQLSDCKFLDSESFNHVEYELKRQVCDDSNRLVYEKPSISILQPNQNFETLNVNSFGFRGDEISKEKSDEEYRIFVVGGSTIFGAGALSDKQTIPGFLQSKIDQNNFQKSFEVINAGVPGANSVREHHYIKNFLLEFDPDMIIIYDGLNDAANAIIQKNDLGAPPSEQIQETQTDIDNFISKNFQFYRTPFVMNFWMFETTKNHSFDDRIIAEMKRNWEERWTDVCEIGKSESIEVVIIIQPILGTSGKELFGDEIEIAKSKNSQLLNRAIDELSGSLENLPDSCTTTNDLRTVFHEIKRPIFYDEGHMNDIGNEIVAEKIFETILPIIEEN